VPFALEPALGCLVLHVSALAAHTRQLRAQPQVSLMVVQPEVPDAPVHALPRIMLDGLASLLEPGSADWLACRSAYLARFPEAEPMTELADFSFVALRPRHGRHIAGFGTARDVYNEEVQRAMGPAPC